MNGCLRSRSPINYKSGIKFLSLPERPQIYKLFKFHYIWKYILTYLTLKSFEKILVEFSGSIELLSYANLHGRCYQVNFADRHLTFTSSTTTHSNQSVYVGDIR